MRMPVRDLGNGARLLAIDVTDDPGSWEATGFTVENRSVALGPTTVRLVDPLSPAHASDRRGIRRWTVSGLDLDAGDHRIDGLATAVVMSFTSAASAIPASAHPNGATGVDHVVVSTPDLDRTIAAFEAVGLACRRIRDAGPADAPFQQAFFRLGATIVEVVGPVSSSGADTPATWFGLAIDVDDLDLTATLLGPALGRAKAAVQPGRRIATVRHREVGFSVSVAFMDHHGGR